MWALFNQLSLKMALFSILLITYFFLLKVDLKYLVFITIVLELFYNTFVNIKMYNGYGNYNTVVKYGELLKDYLPKENEFYRIELDDPITVNDSFILGYYGVDSFSPTITNSSKIFLKEYLKIPRQNNMNYVYQERTVLDPYFLGVKYELVNKEIKEHVALPLVVKTNSFDYFKPTKSLIENSNNLYKMINGENFFEEVDYEIDCINNHVIVNKKCNLKYSKKNGYSYYLVFYTDAGYLFKTDKFAEYTNAIEVDDSFEFDYDNLYIRDVKLYECDKSSLKSQVNDIEVFKDNYIRLNIEKGSYLIMVPYDDSWHVKVNGKEIKKIKVLNSLIGFETDGGVLEIEFIPQGLLTGTIISGTTFLIMIIYYVRKRTLL